MEVKTVRKFGKGMFVFLSNKTGFRVNDKVLITKFNEQDHTRVEQIASEYLIKKQDPTIEEVSSPAIPKPEDYHGEPGMPEEQHEEPDVPTLDFVNEQNEQPLV